jgi:hypothetical protein
MTTERYPSEDDLIKAFDLAVEYDKPIMTDYWIASLKDPSEKGSAKIGVDKQTKEKFLIKSADEYTSKIVKAIKPNNTDIILMTENSIYVVSGNTKPAYINRNQSATPPSAPMEEQPVFEIPTNIKKPSGKTLVNAFRKSIEFDKPMMCDYWYASITKGAIIGQRSAEEKILLKNDEEYTSLIDKQLRVKVSEGVFEYIFTTENSTYIIDSSIESRRISQIYHGGNDEDEE